ncbi:hypothetical protein VP01_2253g2 [Puccinia sorghi]|uniref:NFACT RNA-binding domain-containing protein n=1 Tax=Puccinia sorghi TaxID=27349 RepID=A0A0L6V947_9BASI|nr:hypothetical protein VP01_2253g2 [Puccinia sorghi]
MPRKCGRWVRRCAAAVHEVSGGQVTPRKRERQSEEMVLYFKSNGQFPSPVVDPANPVTLYVHSFYSSPDLFYMGKDKHENEELIKHAWGEDIWFHVDKVGEMLSSRCFHTYLNTPNDLPLSSAHVYIRLPSSMPDMEAIPEPLLQDCAQLVKANSIEGNKRDNLTIIFTPASNLKKTGDMATGQVSFHSDKMVKRVHVSTRVNAIVNRLNKTKIERTTVDLEQEKMEHQKEVNRQKRAIAAQKAKEEQELQAQRKADQQARSYDTLFAKLETETDRDKGEKVEGFDSDDDFM